MIHKTKENVPLAQARQEAITAARELRESFVPSSGQNLGNGGNVSVVGAPLFQRLSELFPALLLMRAGLPLRMGGLGVLVLGFFAVRSLFRNRSRIVSSAANHSGLQGFVRSIIGNGNPTVAVPPPQQRQGSRILDLIIQEVSLLILRRISQRFTSRMPS